MMNYGQGWGQRMMTNRPMGYRVNGLGLGLVVY